MNTSRTAGFWRTTVKVAGTVVLAAMLLLSTLASASHLLHGWLHADHQSPSHYCLVTVLANGQADSGGMPAPLVVGPQATFVSALPFESFFVSHDIALHPERGPPALS